MRNLTSTLLGVAAGAAAMYYLDPEMGRRRRAMVRDKFVSASHDLGDLADAQSKRLGDRLKGWMAHTRSQLTGAARPHSDAQLCERIRAQLGRLVTHPGAIHVEATEGRVCLRGHVLQHEVDGLLSAVSAMQGVHAVDNQLSVHESPQDSPLERHPPPKAGSPAPSATAPPWAAPSKSRSRRSNRRRRSSGALARTPRRRC